MKLFADTNWLCAALLDQKERTVIVERFQRRHSEAVTICPPVLVETRKVLAHHFATPRSEAWLQLEKSIGTRIRLESDWPHLERKSIELLERYAPKGETGTFDLFILGGALLSGASHFLSFDSGSNLRALAALQKLEVIPPLSEEDKSRMAKFR